MAVMKMLQKVQAFIKDKQLLKKEFPVVVATSGGIDSISLLSVLNELGYSVILAHVNHHKRKEAEAEQQAMKALAKAWSIPFETTSFYEDKTKNFHDDAHNQRYAFFKCVADRYQTPYIATAHHLDDQLETILIKLMNGSNLFGYGGISSSWSDSKHTIVRPFLCVTKDEIAAYAREKKLTYFEDSSNREDDYLRNRLRHHFIPLLKEEKPDILQKSQEFSNQLKESFSFIRKQSINYLKQNHNRIDRPSFLQLDTALQKDILCLLFETHDLHKNQEIVTWILHLLHTTTGNKKITLQQGHCFIIEYEKGFITKPDEKKQFEAVSLCLSETVHWEKNRFYFSKKMPQNNAKYLKLCYNDLKLPLKIRSRIKGDWIQMNYGKKKIARLMIDAKFSTEKRKTTPIVTDAEGTILWAVDLASSSVVQAQDKKGDIFLVCEEIENAKRH